MRLVLAVLVFFGIGGGSGQLILTQCPANWIRWKDFCYIFINNATQQITWSQANNECVDLQGHILRIETKEEYDIVKKHLQEYPPSSDGYWTALNDLPMNQGFSTTPVFMWSNDGFPLPGLIQWEKGTDDFGTRNCVNIDVQAKIGFDDCSRSNGYICEVQRNSTAEACPPRWTTAPINNMCYYLSSLTASSLKSWESARKICQSMTPFKDQRQAKLLSIRNGALQSVLAGMLPSIKQTSQMYWTGLNHMTQSILQWAGYTDPFNAAFVSWRQEPNNLANGEHCGAIKWGGVFADNSCRSRKNYICRITLNKVPQFNHGCGAWTRAGHKCVYVHQKPKKNWADARTDCLSHGADLYKISDDDDAMWLRTVARRILYLPAYYIGLNDRGTEDKYVWADGSASRRDLLAWDVEPNYHRDSSTRFCAVLHYDGSFSTRRCIRLHAASICEYKASSSCPSPWVTNGNSCYLIDLVMRTHDEAEDNCRDQSRSANATLLAINSQTEKDYILKTVGVMPKIPFAFWTDLHKPTLADEWQYTVYDYPSMKFVQWASQPNNFNNEDCVVSDPYGYLNDVQCNRPAGFICQYDVNSGDQLHASVKVTWLLLAAWLIYFKLLE